MSGFKGLVAISLAKRFKTRELPDENKIIVYAGKHEVEKFLEGTSPIHIVSICFDITVVLFDESNGEINRSGKYLDFMLNDDEVEGCSIANSEEYQLKFNLNIDILRHINKKEAHLELLKLLEEQYGTYFERNRFSINNKSFLVDARCEDNIFQAFEMGKSIYSIETLPGNIPSTTIYRWKNMDEFVKNVIWLDYIIDGIQDSQLREKVNQQQKTKGGNNE